MGLGTAAEAAQLAFDGELIDALRRVTLEGTPHARLLVDAGLREEESVVDHLNWLLPESVSDIHFCDAVTQIYNQPIILSTPVSKLLTSHAFWPGGEGATKPLPCTVDR